MWEVDRPTFNVLACGLLLAFWWALDTVLWALYQFDLTGGRDENVHQD